MSQTNLSNLETGRTAITLTNLFKIKKVLGCKMADFFVDIDMDAKASSNKESVSPTSIELEDALHILKLLKTVNVKGL